jgi:hypothetical protein
VNVSAFRISFAVLLVAAVGIARAAEAPPTITDAEKSYLATRNSKDRKTQLISERWYGLVRLQEWADASGKFKSTAKYVEQDEKQGTVKLRVFKGAGKDQVITDKTIPIDKLSTECRFRVKQIAFLADKVDEAAKAEAEKVAKPKDGQDAMAGMSGPPPDERGARPARGSKPDRARANDRTKAATGDMDQPEEPPRGDAPADSRVPQRTPSGEEPAAALPPAMAPIPEAVAPSSDSRPSSARDVASRDAAMESRARAANDSAGRPKPVQPANMPDQQPWRTSFDAFRAQFTAERTDSGWHLSWGELKPLQQAHDYVVPPEPGKRLPPPPTLESLGEFAWEAPLAQQPDAQTDWSKALNLTLPEPFKIVCKLDDERGPGDWHRFFPGDSVKLVGRFVGFEGDGGIQIAIRFPDESLAPVPVRSQPPQ